MREDPQIIKPPFFNSWFLFEIKYRTIIRVSKISFEYDYDNYVRLELFKWDDHLNMIKGFEFVSLFSYTDKAIALIIHFIKDYIDRIGEHTLIKTILKLCSLSCKRALFIDNLHYSVFSVINSYLINDSYSVIRKWLGGYKNSMNHLKWLREYKIPKFGESQIITKNQMVPQAGLFSMGIDDSTVDVITDLTDVLNNVNKSLNSVSESNLVSNLTALLENINSIAKDPKTIMSDVQMKLNNAGIAASVTSHVFGASSLLVLVASGIHFVYTGDMKSFIVFVAALIGSILYNISMVPKIILVVKNIFGFENKPQFDPETIDLSVSGLLSLLIFTEMKDVPTKKILKEAMQYTGGFNRAKDGLISIFNTCVKITEYIINGVRKYIIGKSPLRFMETQSEVLNAYLKDSDELLKGIDERSILMTMDTYYRIDSLIRAGTLLERSLWHYPKASTMVASLNKQIVFLRTIKSKIRASNPEFEGMRIEPTGVIYIGDPGVGKSCQIQHTCTALLGLVLDEKEFEKFQLKPSSKTHIRQSESVYWECYDPNQLIVIFDDMGQSRTVEGNPDNEEMNIIRAINSFEYCLHMADISSKGSTFFRSKFVLATTNLAKITANSLVSPEALKRRFHKSYIVCPKIEFTTLATRNGTLRSRRIDFSLLPLGCKDIASLHPDVLEYHSFDLLNEKYLGRVLSFDEHIKEIYDHYLIQIKRFEQFRSEIDQTALKYQVLHKLGNVNQPQARFEPSVKADNVTVEFEEPEPVEANIEAFLQEVKYILEHTEHNEYKEFKEKIFIINKHLVNTGDLNMYTISRDPALAIKVMLDSYGEIFLTNMANMNERQFDSYVKGLDIFFLQTRPGTIKVRDSMMVLGLRFHQAVEDLIECSRKLVRDYLGMDLVYFWESLRVVLPGILIALTTMTAFVLPQIIYKQIKTLFTRIYCYFTGSKWGPKYFWDIGHMDKSSEVSYGEMVELIRNYLVTEGGTVEAKVRFIPDKGIFVDQDFVFNFDICLDIGEGCTINVDRRRYQIDVDHIDVYLSERYNINSIEIYIDLNSMSYHSKPQSVHNKGLNREPKLQRTMLNQSTKPQFFVKPDTNCISIMDSIVSHNTWLLQAEKSFDGDYHDLGFITILEGRVGIIPYHFIKFFLYWCEKDNELYKLKVILSKGRDRKCLMTIREFTSNIVKDFLSENDLCLVLLPDHFQPARSVLRFIPNTKQISDTRDYNCILVKPHNKSIEKCIMRASPIIQELVHPDTYEDYFIQNAYKYNAPCVSGDCGSLLFVQNSTERMAKWFGIHVSGQSSLSVGCSAVMNLDDINKAMEKLPKQVIDTSLDILVPQAAFELNSYFSKIANSIKAVSQGGKTSLKRSELISTWGEPKQAPSRLRPFKREGILIDPMVKAVAKYVRPYVYFDQNILNLVRDSLYDDLLRTSSKKFESRILSYDESVLGIEGIDEFNSIPRNTSAGFPFNITGIGKGKKYYFGSGDNYDLENDNCKKLFEECDEIIDRAKRGERSLFIFTDCLKDERRDMIKVQEGKTRLFSGAPLHYTVIFRKYFGQFIRWIVENRIDNECATGVNPYSLEWDIMGKKLLSFGNKFKNLRAGDYASFDCSEKSQIQYKFLDIINRIYDDGFENFMIRHILWLELVNSRHIIVDAIYEWRDSLPSGHPFTTIMNCLYNKFVFRLAWFDYNDFKLESLQKFITHVILFVLGDDNVFAVSGKHLAFNEPFLSKTLKKYGLDYTNETKSISSNIGRDLNEVEFLKRKWFFNDYYHRFVCPLNLDVIKEMVLWTKDQYDSRQITIDNVDFAISELSLHGKEIFDDFAIQFSKSLYDAYGVWPRSTNYESVLAKVLDDKLGYL